MDKKKWYRSKTLWTNALLFAGVVIFQFTGENPLNAEVVASIIAGVNVVLRSVTKTGLAV
jgi:hypothetical protein